MQSAYILKFFAIGFCLPFRLNWVFTKPSSMDSEIEFWNIQKNWDSDSERPSD